MRTVHIRRNRLPHWTADGGTYFLTFRLADAMSPSLARAIHDRRNRHLLADRILDRGYGRCWLRNAAVARLVYDTLAAFADGVMHGWVVMPNHVHAAVRLARGVALEDVLHFWKGRTARAANQIVGRTGAFWQKESYDTLLHDQNDLNRVLAYTESNPIKAGLKDWPWGRVLDRTFSF